MLVCALQLSAPSLWHLAIVSTRPYAVLVSTKGVTGDADLSRNDAALGKRALDRRAPLSRRGSDCVPDRDLPRSETAVFLVLVHVTTTPSSPGPRSCRPGCLICLRLLWPGARNRTGTYCTQPCVFISHRRNGDHTIFVTPLPRNRPNPAGVDDIILSRPSRNLCCCSTPLPTSTNHRHYHAAGATLGQASSSTATRHTGPDTTGATTPPASSSGID